MNVNTAEVTQICSSKLTQLQLCSYGHHGLTCDHRYVQVSMQTSQLGTNGDLAD